MIAIAITIMVLELRAPEGGSWGALRPLVPTLLTYALSFLFLGIYWNNHHHLLHAADRINGKILWANQHLLFWLSLMPFTTAWVGRSHFAPLPTSLYGVVLLAAAIAYLILQGAIVAHQGPNSKLAAALGGDLKGKISTLSYALAIPLAFVERWLSIGLYVLVALIWLIPDRRIESKLDR